MIVAALIAVSAFASPETDASVAAARGVIARFAGEPVAASLKLEIIPAANGLPVYEIADNGRTLRGSSPVALAKAFYANCRQKAAGIRTWSGKRFDEKAAFAPSEPVRVGSPYRYSQYFNVVTFGYTMPFWDEARWMEELDWMALHGVNMALATIASEEIAARVWKRYGLTDAEIDGFFCGPAFLPWFRMGNLSGRPDSLPKAWRTRSVRIQHAVMKRMRELGIEPIVPGFAGFLPKAFARVRPDARLATMRWGNMPFTSNFLSPDQPLFRELGKAYVEEWEKEFGKCTHYLADSFNEMALPWKTEAETRAGFAACGRNIVGGMRDANPDAVWTLQGWIFAHDPDVWTRERFAALQSGVPANAMLTLDIAVDYIHYDLRGYRDRPRLKMNWDKFPAFGGQPWIWSVIPNMGGNTLLSGYLEYYANGHLEALASPNRGALVGHGMAPEGIENNEVLFELLSEGAWRTDFVSVRHWIREYSLSRYGKCPEKMMEYWDALLSGPYATFIDHPAVNWQKAFGGQPLFARPEQGFQAVGGEIVSCWRKASAAFEACADELADNALYRADRAEVLAVAKAYEAHSALEAGDHERTAQLLLEIDATLKGHPLHDLRRWIAFARSAAEGDEALADAYETGARRLVTEWGDGELNDYSARIWSGLVGTYYLGRMETYFKAKDAGEDAKAAVEKFNRAFIDGRMALK